MSGWIKLHRSLLDWEWWDDETTTRLWITILLSVNHEQKKWKGQTIEAGQMLTSYASLAKKSGLSVQSVRTSINRLKSTHEITCESTHRFTLISVVKWADFQADDRIANTVNNTLANNQPTQSQHSPNTVLTTNKNDKNVKNDKNEKNIYEVITNLYNEICISYPKFTKLSDRRIKALNARLKKYSVEDFRTLFEKAEASDFLKGSNQKDWSATFDWLIKDTNMAKVLDGNYDNRASRSTPAQVTIPMPDYIKDQVEGEAEKKNIFDWLGKY